MVKISIIVPIYNVEKYLEKCINSIIGQKEKNYELLLIDDGSTDSSGTIADNYIKHDNVFVYHKKNSGPSDTRNFGINHSNGEYLMFVDADDYLYDEDCLEKIINAINTTNSDMIMYRSYSYYERQNKLIPEKPFNDNCCVYENVIEYLNIQNMKGRISPAPWDRVVRSKIIKDNNVFFKPGIFCEDLMWSLEVYLKIRNISSLDELIYVYREQRKGSTMTTKTNKTAMDLYNIIKYWFEYEYENIETKDCYYNMLAFWQLILKTTFNNSIFFGNRKIIKELDKTLINYHINYKVNMAYKLSRIIGYRLTIVCMKIYIKIRNFGLMKI